MELIKMLEKQLSLYKELLEIENSKIEILVKGDIKALDDIVKQEQAYMMSTVSAEAQRVQLVEKMGYKDNTLSQIIDDTQDEDYKNALIKLQDELATTFKELKRINGINQKLIKTRLEVIDHLAKQADGTGVLYEEKGRTVEMRNKHELSETI